MKTNTLKLGVLGVLLIISPMLKAQNIALSREQMIELTPKWKGERFPDGRPKVADDFLERMKRVPVETAWAVLKAEGYTHQYEKNWKNIRAGEVLVGRALTVQYMPLRAEVKEQIQKTATKEGRVGDIVSWPIDMLTKGDVYVADSYGKIQDGPIIGSNLGTAILSKSGNGVVFNGAVRDLRDLQAMPGFTSFIRADHPSYQQEMMLTGINVAIRIGDVTVLPGDIILGHLDGVLFIPPHVVERVVKTGELVLVRDEFGQIRLREGKYTSGQVDSRWTDVIEADFAQWINANPDKLPFSKQEMQQLLKDRTW